MVREGSSETSTTCIALSVISAVFRGLGRIYHEGAVGRGSAHDWGVHFFDLVLYILGGAKLKSVSCNAYSEMAKDMKAYKYESMWAEDTKDIEHGTNDVDDYITGYIRTDKASISFNGAWAQNIGKSEMYIDFLGDKGGARLNYLGQFTYWDGATLESYTSKHEIPDMYREEDEAFLQSIDTGVKDKNISTTFWRARGCYRHCTIRPRKIRRLNSNEKDRVCRLLYQ